MNWWNIVDMDITKIWTGVKINYKRGGYEFGEKLPKTFWIWWHKMDTPKVCEEAFHKVRRGKI